MFRAVEYRWVPAYFPFTQPSWEMELMLNHQWTEILGCGVIKQELLDNGETQAE